MNVEARNHDSAGVRDQGLKFVKDVVVRPLTPRSPLRVELKYQVGTMIEIRAPL